MAMFMKHQHLMPLAAVIGMSLNYIVCHSDVVKRSPRCEMMGQMMGRICNGDAMTCLDEGLEPMYYDSTSCLTGVKIYCCSPELRDQYAEECIWVGRGPFCGAHREDCQKIGRRYVRSDKAGDGALCLTGEKVQCCLPETMTVQPTLKPDPVVTQHETMTVQPTLKPDPVVTQHAYRTLKIKSKVDVEGWFTSATSMVYCLRLCEIQLDVCNYIAFNRKEKLCTGSDTDSFIKADDKADKSWIVMRKLT